MTGQSETESESIEVKELESIGKRSQTRNGLQFVCSYSECNAVFKRSDRLKRHLRQHSGERPFVCQLNGCLRSFVCKSYLNKHQKRPHNINTNDKTEVKTKQLNKRYNCNECEKTFKTKFQLRIHCFQHSGQKPFNCEKCDKSFVTQSKLKSHLKTHEGYACGRENCDYKTYKWSELRKHTSVSHKACLKCNFCNKMFNNGYNLGLHKETIHLNNCQKIVCTYDNCDKTYSKKSNLMAHIRSEHNKQLFECTVEACDKSFRHKISLTKHLENHLKPETKNNKNPKKIYRKKVSKASKLTGIELNAKQTKQIMDLDFEFRNQNMTKDS